MTGPADDKDGLVDGYVRELGRRLRGPRRLRHDLLAEVRAGLRDAADANAQSGADPRAAAGEAIQEFGPAEELAPLFQAEIVAAQGRRTAVVIVAAFPGLSLGWDLLWASGLGGSGPTSPLVPVVARFQDTLSLLVGATAAVCLLAFARRMTDPRRPARAAAALGISASAACACMSAVMAILTGGALAHQPFALLAFGASAVVLALVSRSAVRALKLADSESATTDRALGSA